MEKSNRLRIATRIHFGLLRNYGELVEVDELLRQGREGREALWVCDASGDPELAAMARQLREAGLEPRQAAPSQPAPQQLAWAADTSGFGVTQPPSLTADDQEPLHWLRPSSWFRRTRASAQR